MHFSHVFSPHIGGLKQWIKYCNFVFRESKMQDLRWYSNQMAESSAGPRSCNTELTSCSICSLSGLGRTDVLWYTMKESCSTPVRILSPWSAFHTSPCSGVYLLGLWIGIEDGGTTSFLARHVHFPTMLLRKKLDLSGALFFVVVAIVWLVCVFVFSSVCTVGSQSLTV